MESFNEKLYLKPNHGNFLCVQCTIIADKVNWLYVFEVKDYGYKFLKRSLEMQFEKSVIFQVTIFCQRLHAVLNSKSKSCLRYNGGSRLPEPPALALTVSGVPQAIHHRSSSCFEQYQ